mgnify:CR=1 FL=1
MNLSDIALNAEQPVNTDHSINYSVSNLTHSSTSSLRNECRSYFDILADHHGELSAIAADVGIDWQATTEQIHSFPVKLTNGIALESKYRGKVVCYGELYRTKDGREYPVITFHTVKHGGISTTFNGYDYLPKAEYTPPKAKSSEQIRRDAQKTREKEQKKAAIDAKKQNTITYKTQRFNDFNTLFDTLPRVTDSAYLQRKGINVADIPADFLLKQGHDRRGNFIAYPLCNVQHQRVGFQKIYDMPFQDAPEATPRDKDFIFLPDAKKGSFALIGETGGKRMDIAEGLASALSCYISTGIICAVALDANNMQHVAKTFSELRLRLIADNDVTDGKGNVGLYTALKIAYEQGARVSYPVLHGEKCDFNDVYVAKGCHQVKKQLNTNTLFSALTADEFHCYSVKYAPQIQLNKVLNKACFYIAHTISSVAEYKSRTIELIKYAQGRGIEKHFIRKTIKRMFQRYALKNINKKHSVTNFDGLVVNDMTGVSNPDIAAHILKDGGLFALNGGMGSGKTETMVHAANVVKIRDINHRKVVYICPRVSLASGGAKRLDLRYYENVQTQWQEVSDCLSVCVNSIPKHSITDANLVMIDEFRQMIEFISTGSVKNRKEVQAVLIETINNAETIILADADMNDFCIEWLKKHTNKTIQLITSKNNTHHKQITVLDDAESVLVEANNRLEKGENVWITSDSKIQVHKSKVAFEMLTDVSSQFNVADDEILIITGDNKGEEAQKAFLENPDEESKKYRLIISTPVISSGVSITNTHFKSVYAIFSNVVPANEMLQAVGRVRAVNDIRVSFKKGHKKSRETIIHHLMDGEALKNSRFLGNGLLEIDDMAYQQAQITATVNDSLNNFDREFLILAQLKGYGVKKKGEKNTITGLSKRANEYDIQRVLTAQPITEDNAIQLKRTKPETQSERDSLDRYLVEEMAGKTSQQLNEDDITFYKNNGTSTVQNYELIHTKIDVVRSKEKLEYNECGESNGKTSRALFMQKIITRLDGKTFKANDVDDLMQSLQKHHAELNANQLGDFKWIRRPIVKLKNLLSKMGYEVILSNRTQNDRYYKMVKNVQVVKYVENRKKLQTEKSNDTTNDYI